MTDFNDRYFPRLRELRVLARCSQTELAAHLQIQQNQYSRYERGEREIPLHLLVVLARYYHVSLDYIVGLSHDPGR